MAINKEFGTTFLEKSLRDLVLSEDEITRLTGVFIQAAEIEEENIKNAYNKGKEDSVYINEHTSEDYITRTFFNYYE